MNRYTVNCTLDDVTGQSYRAELCPSQHVLVRADQVASFCAFCTEQEQCSFADFTTATLAAEGLVRKFCQGMEVRDIVVVQENQYGVVTHTEQIS